MLRFSYVRMVAILLISVVLLLPVVTALGQTFDSGAFVALLEYEPILLDPSIAYDVAAANVFSEAYETLIKPIPGTTTPSPGLAVSWSVSDDGTTWIFNLRHGVVFHDGTPFTADAVKFTFERLMKINQGPAWMFSSISEINVVNDYMVEIVLSYAYAPFLAALAQPMGALIISPGVMQHETDGDMAKAWLYDHVDGTGPYKLETWIHGQELILETFGDYWNGWEGDHFSRIIYRVVPEHASQQLLLDQGVADASDTKDGLPLEALSQLKQSGKVVIYASPGETVDIIGFNTAKGPCSDVRVRQALSYAMDYAGVANSLYFGSATVARGPLPPTFWGFDDSLNTYSFDLDKARQLLAEAGYSTGLVLNAITDENALRQREMQTLASALDQIGVKVNIRTMTWPTEYAALTKLETAPDLYSFTWYADYGDPDDVTYPMFASDQRETGFNLSWYSNEQLDSLFEQAKQERERTERVRIYAQIQNILVADAPVIWIVNPDIVFAINADIQGFVYTPFWAYNVYSLHRMSQ